MLKSTKRVNLNLDADLVNLIDIWSSRHGVTRTAAISFLCSFGLKGFDPKSEKSDNFISREIEAEKISDLL